MIYEDEDNEIYKTYTLLDQYRKGMYSQVLRCLNSKGNMCYLKITNKPSGDGMSEEIYPYEVILEEEGSKIYGVSSGH